MIRFHCTAFLAFMLLMPCAVAQDEGISAEEHIGVVKAAIDGYILPAHKNLVMQTGKLDAEVGRFCIGRAKPDLERVIEEFRATALAFGSVSFFRFGPWVEGNRLERFAFWPDRKGIGVRQVRRALKAKKRDLLQAEKFKKRSVALQGLTALEYLVFIRGMEMDEGGSGSQDFICEYAMAITANLHTIAKDVLATWRGPYGYGQLLLTPGADNPAYQTAAESAKEVVKSVILALLVIRDQMLKPIVGTSVESAKPKRAFLRRSGLSISFIAAQFTSLKKFVKTLRLASYVDDGLPWIKKSLTFDFDKGVETAQQIKLPIIEAVGDEQDRKKLLFLTFSANKLHQLIAKSIVPQMGLELGFNALDGD